MPYIKQDDRPTFKNTIEDALGLITKGSEPLYVKGEYFGYLANRVIKRFCQSSDADNNSFNSLNFNPAKRGDLTRVADKLSSLIFNGDPIEGAGELNYVVSAIFWGIQGCANSTLIGTTPSAGYGLRAYLGGMLEQIRDDLNSVKFASPDTKDRVMLYRRLLVTKRVVNHILAEDYRVNLTPYEESKIEANGSIFTDDGSLNVDERELVSHQG